MNKSKGFTLIELMVVVLIIGLLASIVIVNVNNSRINARDAKRVQDIDTINSAIQMYADANGQYPSDLNTLTLAPAYISVIPKDPKGASYIYVTNGSDYKIESTPMEGTAGKNKALNTNDGGTDDSAFELFSSGGADL